MKEIDLMHEIQIKASEQGHRLFRNNVGLSYTGKPTYDPVHRTFTVYDAKPIRFGLCVGSSDLVGLTKDGRFLAIEVKTGKGRRRPEQESFITMVRHLGGIGIVARTLDDFNI